MLVPGDPAPEFTATSQDGTPVRLSALRGSRVVLYFYPKAGSPGCTRESVAFAEHHEEFRARGVQVVGISVDDVEHQHRFAEKCQLPFPLLSDRSRDIARSYGALGAFGHAKRMTFLIDDSGRIADVVEAILPGPHVDRARRLFLGAGAPSPPR